MFKPISLFIGYRYTRAKRSNRLVSFMTLSSVIGLSLGVMVLITVLSVMNGFDRELKNRVLGMVPQATVASNEIIPDWQRLAKDIAHKPHVTGVAPFTQLQGMVSANGQVSGVVVSGIDPEYEKNVSIVHHHMYAGSIDQLKTGEYGIVLGKKIADDLGLGLNDSVTLILPEATQSIAGVMPRFKRFNIVGIFNVGAEVDAMVAYIALNDAATLLRLPEGAQGLRLKLDDIFLAAPVANNIVNELKQKEQKYFYPSDWSNTHGTLFNAIQMEKTLVGLLLFLIIIVAAFNIISSLVMTVNDKNSDIAILRTLGATPRTIMHIFMVQGSIVGVVGTIIGTILGIISSLTISDILAFFMRQFAPADIMDSYFIQYVPSYIKWQDIVIIVSASLILSFLVTIYPAYRASKVQPAEALRYE